MRISDWSSDVCSSDLSGLKCSTSTLMAWPTFIPAHLGWPYAPCATRIVCACSRCIRPKPIYLGKTWKHKAGPPQDRQPFTKPTVLKAYKANRHLVRKSVV